MSTVSLLLVPKLVQPLSSNNKSSMAEKLRIFVSATKDLEQERALVGRVLAGLPLQVGAEIRRTPAEGVDYDTLFELISNVDRIYFLLGRDITAPFGAEWQLALRLERTIVPFKLQGMRTQAGREFLRIAHAPWKSFHNSWQLGQQIGLDLVDTLLHPKNRYGLQLAEVEGLQQSRQNLRQGLERFSAPPMIGEKGVGVPGGAEGGGVILDPAEAQARIANELDDRWTR